MDNETKMYIDTLFNEQNKRFDRLWEMVTSISNDMNSTLVPRQKIIHQPGIATETTLDENIRRGISDARKSDSFLSKTKPMIPIQSKVDAWVKPSGWTYKQWEDWARSLYNTYPEARKYLPEWFIKTLG